MKIVWEDSSGALLWARPPVWTYSQAESLGTMLCLDQCGPTAMMKCSTSVLPDIVVTNHVWPLRT